METKLKILMLEDLQSDAWLIQSEIRKNGIQFTGLVVDTKEDFIRGIQNFKPDLILSDFSLPSFDGLSALQVKVELIPNIPFILVTGSINEETAVEVMKAGADDYVIKDHIARLGRAIITALEKKETLRLKNKAEEQNKILLRAVEQNPASIVITGTNGLIEYVNPKFSEVTGYSFNDAIGKNPSILKSGNTTQEEYKILWETITSGHEWRGQFLNLKKNGNLYSESAIISPIANEHGTITHFLAVKEDISEKIKAEETIIKNEERFKQVVESSGAWVWEIDPNGLYTYVSGSCEDILGYKEDEIVGKKYFYDFFTPEVKDDFIKTAFDTFSRKANFKNFENPNLHKNGQVVILETNGFPILDMQGNLLGYRGADRDITERKQVQRELIAAKEKAEESDRLKSAFLANMSHEVRTPLNSILGFSELLLDPDFDPAQQTEFAKLIYANGNNLLAIINDIMDISKIEAGQINIVKRDISVGQMMADIQKEFQHKAVEKGIELRIPEFKPGKEIHIFTDGVRLKQILINLLGNALKFTKSGYIELDVENTESLLQFRVTDTGIGVAEENHKKIFERFHQIENGISRSHGGNGLGLAISKNLVELMGGKIWVKSGSDKGATFYFTLPASN